MESLASQAKPAAVLWLAGFLQAARLHRVVSFCASSRPLTVRIAQCFLLNGLIYLGSLLTLKLVVIPILSWILPEECGQLQGQHLCDHPVAVATYSLLRSVLIQIFYLHFEYTLHALDVVKSKSLDATKALDARTISESTEKPEGFDGYKWNFFAVSLNERLDFFESNWAFFAGFGTQSEKVIDQLKPSHGGKLQRIPVFFVAKRLT
uniref:Uncharacterized protein n=1 Tax=Leersia perrieri TaxID=77586 RepID=A0A0D9W538_9ORYZ